TGQVSVIDLRGRVVGTARLAPSIAFGNGDGVALNDDGTTAAVIAVTRDAIGGAEHHDLATIDLANGAVRVYETPELDESSPVFVDDGTVALFADGHLRFVDLTTGTTRDAGVIYDGPFTRTNEGEVVVGRRAANGAVRLLGVDRHGDSRQIAVLKPHRKP